ncbi:hypothetical protein Tco_1473084, partial [Tanacetum coccineum]
TDEAQSSRVPILLSDDPIRAVRQTHLVDTDIESGPLEDLRETEIPQPLPSAPSLILPSDDHYWIVSQTHTPATIDTESEPEEAPLETGEFEASEPSDTKITSPHSTAPSDSTTSLSPDHPLAQTSHAPTRASYYRSSARAAALSHSSFRKRYRSSYETPSPLSSLTLPIRKRYQGTSNLVEDTKDESSDSDTEREGSEDECPSSEDEGHGSEDEGPGLEEEEAAPEGQQQALPVVDTATDEPLGLDYGALRHHELALEKGSVPSIYEIGQSSSSLLVSLSSPAVPTPVASLVTTLTATIAVGEDEFLEEPRAGAGEGYSDICALWRPVLALESWAGYVNTQRAEIWRARYDDHRLIHDLLVQNTKMQRELQELRGRVTTLEQKRSRREQ